MIMLVAAVPVALLGGLTGSSSRPLVLAYTLAVLASMVVALAVTPALGLLLLSGERRDGAESPITRWLRPRYDRALSHALRSVRWAYVAVVALVLAAIAMLPFLRTPELLPPLRERQLVIGVGRCARHLASGDVADRGSGQCRAARDLRRPGRERPRGSGHHLRPGRRGQLQ